MRMSKLLCLGFLFGFGLAGCGLRHTAQHRDRSTRQYHDIAASRQPDESEDLSPQWIAREGRYLFQFRPEPAEPRWDQDVRLDLVLYEVHDGSTRPVSGAGVACKTVMAHGGGERGIIHDYILHEEHPEASPGEYAMKVRFGVGGHWRVEYRVALPDGKKARVAFPLRVLGTGDVGKDWKLMQPPTPGRDKPKDTGPLPHYR